jgi:hypothetical protein
VGINYDHGNTDYGNTDCGNTDYGNTDYGNTDYDTSTHLNKLRRRRQSALGFYHPKPHPEQQATTAY